RSGVSHRARRLERPVQAGRRARAHRPEILVIEVVAAIIVSAAVVWAARLIASAVGAAGSAAQRDRELTLLHMFAPAIAATERDPQALVVWQPLARAARTLFPEEFAHLDAASGAAFPFSAERIASAHAHWTADWLAWERTHDAEYKRRAAEAE